MKKQKGESGDATTDGPRGKRYRTSRDAIRPEMETLEIDVDETEWWAQGKSDDQVLEALRAVIDSA